MKLARVCFGIVFVWGLLNFGWAVFMVPVLNVTDRSNVQEALMLPEDDAILMRAWDYLGRRNEGSQRLVFMSGVVLTLCGGIGIYSLRTP